MGTLTDKLKRSAELVEVEGFGQVGDREQAIIDRYRKNTNPGSLRQKLADAEAKFEIDTRQQQRAYAEQAPPEAAAPVKEMLSSLGDRSKVLDIYRKMSPEQRQEALKLAPGLAQQLGDDRGGAVNRTLGALSRGVSHGVSQPVMELTGMGGTDEEIEYIRQLDAAASQEFSPARPGDPWYQRGPLQATEMAPWMSTVVAGNWAGNALARVGGQLLARGASAGVPGAKAAFQAVGAVGKVPTAYGLKGATTKATMATAGGLAGTTAAAFPSQYAQEVDQLKEMGMEDGRALRLLAGGTAAISGLIEGIVPNPLKAGPVSLTEGAVKAARQYLWNAAKQAPGEMSEEYLQGVTSGLGKHVAQYLDANVEDKSIVKAFDTGYEQAKEAALPMAFLLGVPAAGGAGVSAVQARLARLQEVRAKGFVSLNDAKNLNIEGKNRKERLANTDKQIEELTKQASEPPEGRDVPNFGTTGDLDPNRLVNLDGSEIAQPQPPADPATPPAATQPGATLEQSPPQDPATQASQDPAAESQGTTQTFQTASGSTYELHPDGTTTRNRAERGDGLSTGPQPRSAKTWFADDNELNQLYEQWNNPADVTLREITAANGEKRLATYNHKTGQYGNSIKFSTEPKPGLIPVEYWSDDMTIHYGNKIVDATKPAATPITEWNGVQKGGTVWLSGTDAVGAKLDDVDDGAAKLLDILPSGELLVKQSKGGAFWIKPEQVSAKPPQKSPDPERDQAEDELAGLLGEETPSTAGPSEETGTTPTTVPPTASPDAPAKPETSKGETAGDTQSSEARAGDTPTIEQLNDQELLIKQQLSGVPKDSPRRKKLLDDLNDVRDKKIAILESKLPADAADPKGTAAPPATATVDRDADIDRAISNFKKSWGMEATATPVDKLSAEQQEALDFATSRGQKLAFVDIAKSDKKAPIGSFQRDDKVVLISNELKGDKLWGMIGHEMAHSKGLDEILPADSAELKQMMDEYFQSASPDVQKRLKTNKRDHMREGRARMVQKFFEDKAFRDRLMQNNPTLWDKLREAVLKFIGKWTPKDEANRMLLDELRAAPKPKKRTGKKPAQEILSEDKKPSVPTDEQPSRTVARTRQRAAAAAAEGITPYVTVLRTLSGGRRQYEGYNPTTGERIATGNAIAGPGSVPYKLSNRKGRYQAVDTALYPIGESDTFTTQWYESEAARYDKETDERIAKDKQDAAETTPASADQVNVDSGAESKVKTEPTTDDLEAMIEAEFDAQLGTKKPAKKSTGKKSEKPKVKVDTSKYGDTPIGRQFAEAKAAGGDDTILFFRMGDFYELYFEDAQKAAKILGLTLVTRDKSAENPIPMAGFPYHQIDGYLQKLKSAGFRVAVNEAPFPPRRTGKKEPSKPKTRIQQAADTARQEADDLWAELNKQSKDKLTTGLDPDLAKLAVRVALAEIKAGTLSFAAFVEQTVAKVPADMLDKLKPYMEMSWKVAHKRGMTNDPGGRFDDVLAKKATGESNETSDTAASPADQAAGAGDRRDGQDTASAANADVLEDTSATDDGQAEGAGDTGGVRNRPGGKVRRGSGKADSRGVDESERGGTDGGRASTDDTGGRGAGIDRAPQATRPNYHLTNPEAIIGGGPKAKFERNRKAIEIVRDIEETGRVPTAEELDTLAGYTGWGAFGQQLFKGTWEQPQAQKGWEEENEWLRIYLGEADWKSANQSIVNAHYTDPQTVTAMWDMLRRMGFNGGRVLEPSMGIGNFFSLMPRDMMERSTLTGIELDTISAKIAKLLHPQANIQQKGYQESQTPDNFYDVVVSNVPFGNYPIADRRYKQDFSIHNYFFKRAFDQVKPGGVIAFLTSNTTMDGKTQAKLMRAQIAEQGDLVTAIRLPSGAFQAYAGTKVVADLIVIRKRKPGEEPMAGQDWIEVIEMDTPAGQKITVNEYWDKNPKNILGKMTWGHGTTSGRPGMIVEQPDNLQALLDKAVQSVPEGIINTERTQSEGRERPNTTAMRQNSVISESNDLWIVKGEQLVPLIEFAGWYRKGAKQSTIDANRREIESLLDVREAMRTVLDQQAASEDATEARAELNRVYDAFVAKHGPIGKSAAAKHLRKAGEPTANTLLALEEKKGDKYVKRPIFQRPTVRQRQKVDNPTINDAFAMERNRSLDLDIEKIAEAAKVSVDEVVRQLESEGKIYKTGTGTYDAADVFLSGNMARKLRQLEAAKAEGIEGLDRSIEAVRDRIPTPVPYSQIEAKLGATWVEGSDYADFLGFLLNEPSTAFQVERRVNGWKVSIPTDINSKTEAQHTHGHRGIEFNKLMNAAMNNAAVKLTMPDPENPDSRIADPVATAEANAKIGELREKFANWIWTSPERITRLSGVYNEEFNSTVTPEFDDVPLQFEGMALQRGDQPFNLRKHQESAVWRGIVSGKGIFAHEVGTGKTLTIAALAMESRRLGLASKPLLLAHNANSMAVRNEVMEAYPNANVLYIDNLDAKNKAAMLQAIATENWDLIVVPHSMAERFQLRPETVEALLKPEMDALEAAALEAFEESESSDYAKGEMPADLDTMDADDLKRLKEPTAKELVKERLKLRAKIEEAVQAMQKGEGMFFEDMGIDMVMVDEAHLFKKLPITTKQNIKGLNKTASQRGTMLMMLTDYVRNMNNGRGAYLFTGTPITNTINEIYNMMRFVMAEEMDASGVRGWDGWFNNFATQETLTELSSGGTWENFDRLSSFVNLPELRQMVGQYMDIVFADEMPEFRPRDTREGRSENPVGRPYKQVHNVTTGMLPSQASHSEQLKQRYTTFKNAPGKEKVRMMREPGGLFNPLVIEGEGVKLAMDPRLVRFGVKVGDNGQLTTDEKKLDPKDPQLKINRMLNNAMAHYNEHPKSAQMIFMQIGHDDWTTRTVGRTAAGKPITERIRVFNLAKEIKRRLMEEGVPEDEIAMFSTMSKEKRTETAQLMKEGKVRFAIGSTETMGTGVNAQDELIAMHHLDAPWMPGDLEQRNGRGHRQGNKWNTVHEYRYLTEGPQDGRRWQVLLTKSRFIEKFMKADGTERTIEMDDVDMSEDGAGNDMEKTFAAAAGDPRIMMRIRLEGQVAKLERSRDNHARTITETVSRANQKMEIIERQRAGIKQMLSDYQIWADNRPAEGDKPSIRIRELGSSSSSPENFKTIVGLTEVNDALKEREERYRNTIGAEVQIGEYRGLPLFMNNGVLYVGNSKQVATWSMASLQGIMANTPERAAKIEKANEKDERFIEMAHKAVGEPFPKQKQLDSKRAKLDALLSEMEANPDISPAWLRAGAPIGTAVYHKGVEYEVSGHRKDTEVLYSDGDKFVALPAKELTDKDGTPIFPELQETVEEAQSDEAKPKTKLGEAAEKANQELADAVDEFGNVIKGKLGMNLPLNPEVIAAAAKVVAKAIKAGTLNFAELMERMVAKYGEKMAKRMEAALQQEWDRQVNAYPVADEDGTPPETPQPHPELVPPEAIPLTSVKNAIVDELRTQRGQDLMPEVAPQTVQQWLDAAGNRIASDPYAGNTLVEQLLSGEKTSVDEMEGMVLQYHYRAVNNLFEAADTKLTEAKANGDAAAIAIAQDDARVIMRRLSAIETALDKAGTAWGRAGVSRQIFLKQDFSLASMVRRARVANGGNELSDEQVAKISEQAKQIEDLQKRIAELEAKTAEQEQQKAIDEAIKKDIEETKKPAEKPKSKVRLKAEERVASAWEKVGAVLKGKLYANPIDLELLKPALELVKAYYDLGKVTFREFMAMAAKNMGAYELKAAEPTFRAAWDQLAADGEIAQPSLDITNAGQLTRFARQVQRSLIENGVTEREEIVDAVHDALREILPEITRRQTMDALSSYGQFSQLSKDPIDQIIRDINGQLQQLAKLEDMEKGIAPAKTGVERRTQSDEERRLTKLVNEAKRRGGFVVTDPETQLKSAMAAAKTAVRNRIADMTYEIQTGSRIVRGKTELIPDAELEQLRKDRDELQKIHKAMFPPKGATQAQKIASANRALDAAIASLEAKLAAGDVSPAPQPKPLSTPELDAKRARLKGLNDQRNALRKMDEQTRVRALDRSIEALEKELAAGDFTLKPKPTPLTSPEINARQAKLESLRATKKALVAAANPDMAAQRASRAYEAHLRTQLAMYLEKIAQGDFDPKPKKPPRVLTKAELDLKKQLADVKHDFFEALSKYHLDNLSPMGRAVDIVRESAHLSRAIMTSFDLSAVLRQGGLGVYSHPVIARKAAAEMWQSIWSREAEFQSMEKLRARPNAQLYEESGLNITDSEGKLTRQEEAFMGRWARTGVDFAGKKVQATTKLALEPVAASARAYVTFINNLRADLFDAMVENLGQGGAVTKEEAKLIAKYINVATGRSDLKALNDAAATLNTVFFAPRYVASRFQYLAMPFYLLGTKDSARVKRLIAMEYARTFTGAAVFIGSLAMLAYLAAGDDEEEKPSVEFNPLSADFGKVRIDETRVDPLAGLAQVIVFSLRMASFHTKSSTTGKIKPFYDGGPFETTHGSEAWRFLRTKLAPVPGAVVTAMSGMEDVVGDPVTPAGLVVNLFVPISVGEVISTMQHRGIPKGTAMAILNSLGAAVNTYGPKTAYIEGTPEERAKMVKDYIKYMNWESDLPAFSQYLPPEDLKQVQDRQDERRGDLVFEALGELKPKGEYKSEAHYEEAKERHEKVQGEFEEFRKQFAPTYSDALRYLLRRYDDEGGVKVQGAKKLKPGFIERRARLAAYYQQP